MIGWLRAMVRGGNRIMDREGVWKGAGWGIAVSALIDGASFLALGNSVAPGPSYSLLVQVPYGIRTLGFFMTVVALGLFVTVHRRGRWTTAFLLLAFFTGVVIVCYTIGGWINMHQVGISGLSKWFLLAWLSLWLAATTRRQTHGGSRHVPGGSRN